jgi:hypothetical protein
MRNALTVSDASCCFMLLPHLTCAVRLCIWSAEQFSKLSRSKRNEQGQAPQKLVQSGLDGSGIEGMY